jgi:hypothetical protein
MSGENTVFTIDTLRLSRRELLPAGSKDRAKRICNLMLWGGGCQFDLNHRRGPFRRLNAAPK